MSIRGIIYIGVILFVLGGIALDGLRSWWRGPPPPSPPPTPAPTEVVMVDTRVTSVSRVTRGSSFEHDKVTFENAPTVEGSLNVLANLPEETMRQSIGERVSVACKRRVGVDDCFWLTRLTYKGRELYSKD